MTGVTLSTEQLAWAQQRLADAGLADQADLRLQDYRDIADGPFDAIVSIEMFEAVGREYWPGFFAHACTRCSSPAARACIQSITIRDDLFERYVRSHRLHPAVHLPRRPAAQPGGVSRAGRARPGCDVVNELRLRRRLRRDAAPLARALPGAGSARCAQLGFDERFMRIWEFYLAYCEAAFATGNTDVVQFTLQRGMSAPPLLPRRGAAGAALRGPLPRRPAAHRQRRRRS